MSGALLESRGLSVSIGGKDVCRGLDFAVRAGEAWAILGTNGVGKTTLLHTLAGLRAPLAGEILVQGVPIGSLRRREVARRVAVMLQETEVVFPLSVREAVLEGRHPHLHRFGWESAADERLAQRVLEELAIDTLAARAVQTLSGGERRLVAVATLFLQEAPLMMLDEPSSHLDLHQQLHVLGRVIARVRANAHGALLALHDVNLAARFCDHAILLHGGARVSAGPIAEVLTTETIEEVFRHPVVRLAGPAGAYFVAR